MPAIYHEGSWLGNATDPEVLVKDTVGWTGKNLIPYPYSTDAGTINGITITDNGDGSITMNGTATAGFDYQLRTREGMTDTKNLEMYLNAGKEYIVSGNINVSGCHIYIGRTNNSSWQTLCAVNTEAEQTFLVPVGNTTRIAVNIHIDNGIKIENKTFYPMIRRADITDPTYEPYHESVEEEIEQVYADNGVLGAKNLLNPTYAGGTVNGVTITANDNKTYKLNGAPSSGNMAVPIYVGTFPVGRYILNGVPDFTTYGARLHIRETAGASQVDAIDTGKGIEFAIPSATTSYSVFMYLNSGYTANNLVIRPMIRLASDPDDTYQPYAMTNRELTEKKADIYTKGDTVQCGVSLVGHITSGTTKLELTLRGNFDKANISNVSVGTSRILIRGTNGYLKTDNAVELSNVLFSDYLKLDAFYIFPQYIDLRIGLISGGAFTNVDNNTLIDIQNMTLILS